MLRFRYTCARHQRDFVAATQRAGCFNLSHIDQIRRRVLAWMSARFPRLVFEHFSEESCLGCKLEASGIPLTEVQSVIMELAEEFALKEAGEHRSQSRQGLAG
jgi:hypothetical protein